MKCLIQSRPGSRYPAARLRIWRQIFLAKHRLILVLLLAWGQASVAAPAVEVSVKPVHSIASRVMQGVGQPGLLIDGTQSPHGASLRPTQARALQRADLVFWVGPELESGLASALKNITRHGRVVPLLRATIGLKPQPFRVALAEPDGRGDNKHGESPAHDATHRHESEDSAHRHGHGHAGLDPHFWLDPDRAAIVGETIAAHLAKADPDNAAIYKRNAAELRNELAQLADELTATLGDIKPHPVLVFHDAYQYFEQRFGLQVTAVVTFNPDIPSSASHIRQVRQQIESNHVRCAFSEPQFSARAMRAVLSGIAVRLDVLDPLGAKLPAGSGHYPAMMRAMAATVSACLRSG